MRMQAFKQKVKASKFVNEAWSSYQCKLRGAFQRVLNKFRGTHRKKTWPMRYNLGGDQ